MCALGWVVGILFGYQWNVPLYICLALGFVTAAALVVSIGARQWTLILAFGLFTICLLGGAFRMDRALSSPLRKIPADKDVSLRGVVEESPTSDVYILHVSSPASGTALITTAPGSTISDGDSLLVQGTHARTSDLEAFEQSLARSAGADLVILNARTTGLDAGREGVVSRLLADLRLQLSFPMERYIPQQYAPVAEGLLLGGSNDLDPEIKADFRASGISHILAASGYNVAVFSATFLVVLRPVFGSRRVLPFALLSIVTYALLAGLSASVVRAALMASVAVVGLWLGRQADSGRALAVAVIAMTLWQPFTVFDVGAQLSFAATAGLIWLYPVVVSVFGRMWRPLAESLGVALTAYLVTLPLGMYYFGNLQPWSLVTNLIVEPLVPTAMLFSALTTVGDLVWPGFGAAPGWVTTALIQSIVETAHNVSLLPGSNAQVQSASGLVVIVYYLILAFAVAWGLYATSRSRPHVSL